MNPLVIHDIICSLIHKNCLQEAISETKYCTTLNIISSVWLLSMEGYVLSSILHTRTYLNMILWILFVRLYYNFPLTPFKHKQNFLSSFNCSGWMEFEGLPHNKLVDNEYLKNIWAIMSMWIYS